MLDSIKKAAWSLVGNLYFQQFDIQKKQNIDFVKSLPKEIIQSIFCYLTAEELTKCFRVNKTWKVLATDKLLWKALLPPPIAFGKKQWEKYFGNIGEEPPLPRDIYKILKSPCPFFPGKKVEDTHLLILIPKTVNGKSLDLVLLEELIKAPKKGRASQYAYSPHDDIWHAIIKEHGNQSPTESYWVLMLKNVIEGSRNKSYTDQQALITTLARQAGTHYNIPSVLEAAICIFMHYVSDQERLFNHQPWTYTRCREKIRGYPVVIGGFSPTGLYIHVSLLDSKNVGITVLREFL